MGINYMLRAHARMITASKWLSTVRKNVRNPPPRPMIICALPLLAMLTPTPDRCRTEKLLFRFTSLFGCSLTCLLLLPSGVCFLTNSLAVFVCTVDSHFPVLICRACARSISCDMLCEHITFRWRVTTYVGKLSAVCQPTRPTQPFILSGSINEQYTASRCLPPQSVVAPSGECLWGKGRYGVMQVKLCDP